MAKFDWQWQNREKRLAAKGLVVFGEACFDLLERLEMIEDSERKEGLQIIGFANGLVVLGALDHLPWCDGGHYIGHDSYMPQLWLPLHLVPNAPLDLLMAALKRRYPVPVLLWPEPKKIIDLHRQFPIQSGVLSLLRERLEGSLK